MKAGSKISLISKLTSLELSAVKAYTDTDYVYLDNSGNLANLLDSAISKSVLTKPITVYRVAYVNQKESRYISTTKDKFTAMEIMKYRYGAGANIYKIKLPAGTHALDINKVLPSGLNKFEKEVLLPRGTKFKLGKTVIDKYGNTVIDKYGNTVIEASL